MSRKPSREEMEKAEKRRNRYNAFKSKQGGGGGVGSLWEEVDPAAVHSLIGAVTEQGDCVMFATTRDGGSMSLTIISGEDRLRNYETDPAMMSMFIEELVADLRKADGLVETDMVKERDARAKTR